MLAKLETTNTVLFLLNFYLKIYFQTMRNQLFKNKLLLYIYIDKKNYE